MLALIMRGMPITVPLEVASPASAVVKIARVTLTHAQILALNGTPVTMSDAPGANRVILPLTVCMVAGCAAGAYGSNPNINILLGGVAINSVAAGLTVAQNRVQAQAAIFPSSLFSTVANQPLVVQAASNNTVGNAANTLKIIVAYLIVEFP
jgi:hypothetical protein